MVVNAVKFHHEKFKRFDSDGDIALLKNVDNSIPKTCDTSFLKKNSNK